MGRSLQPIADVAPRQRYDAGAHNPFDALGYRFRVERSGEHVWHCQERRGPGGEALLDFRLEVHYAIGSGARGRSYLSDRDGYVFQTAVSWYAEDGIWDKSPGFDAALLPGRPISEDCLFCHANRAAPVPGFRNRFDRPFGAGHAIGCERCHGPGEEHCRHGGAVVDGRDPTIVNPRKLGHALREAVCQQCHLEGEGRVARRGRRRDEFRPGLPLESVLAVFVHAGEGDNKLVTHVEQMYRSACFRGSAGKLGCVSCHDPHRQMPAGERVEFYRRRCLECHAAGDCGAAPAARTAKLDSCADCHMPRGLTSDVTHVARTDHRVIRPGKARQPAGDAPDATGALEPFIPRGTVADDPDLARDLGIALATSATPSGAALEQAVAMLRKASADFPDDLDALEAQGVALLSLGRSSEAAAVLKKVLDRAADREAALERYATACEAAGQPDAALAAWRRAVALNPWMPKYREPLAALLIKQGAWKELYPHAEAWLRLDPGNVAAHKAWIAALARTGQGEKALAALAHARALHPLNRGELDGWFEEIRP
jgi:tetratricopeptide (TPR) repeat protein